ncbi:MAG: helix-turn-helix transcriptional regulator [Alphaproteobacteria bacterium]|nr:helix-turn-helix transcriptional regulator [Alphaproteobacteria bacterium]
MVETAQRSANRRDVARVFRERLAEAMARSGLRAAGLAARIGVDRSTLSQLLSGENDRLPRADTVAAMAGELQVSLDWLLGLSSETRRGADILHESMEIARSAQTPVDQQLVRWQQEATGYKIRHVPATLPDLVKTDEVLHYEYQYFVARDPNEAISAGSDKLESTRTPEADMEVCMRIQDLRALATGTGLWQGLDANARRDQFDRMTALYDELYPSLRIYLYDGLTHYSVPYTIFGPIRAALYVGQLYFVFNTRDHIRVLTRHFDELIKGSVVQANDFPSVIAEMRASIA